MLFPAEAVLEACYPLGDKNVDRATKRRACRRCMIDGWTYRAAASEIPEVPVRDRNGKPIQDAEGRDRTKKVSHTTVMDWCSETEMRVQFTGAWAAAAGAIF